MGGDFPDGPVVRTPYFHCRGRQPVQFLVRELKILHAGQCSKKNKKQKKPQPPKTRKQAPKMGENICIWIIMMTEESTLFNIINKEMHMKTIQTYFDFQDIKI